MHLMKYIGKFNLSQERFIMYSKKFVIIRMYPQVERWPSQNGLETPR